MQKSVSAGIIAHRSSRRLRALTLRHFSMLFLQIFANKFCEWTNLQLLHLFADLFQLILIFKWYSFNTKINFEFWFFFNRRYSVRHRFPEFCWVVFINSLYLDLSLSWSVFEMLRFYFQTYEWSTLRVLLILATIATAAFVIHSSESSLVQIEMLWVFWIKFDFCCQKLSCRYNLLTQECTRVWHLISSVIIVILDLVLMIIFIQYTVSC